MPQLSSVINDINAQQIVEENVYKLAGYVEDNYKQTGYSSAFDVKVTKGRKYYKITTDNSVHAFIDIHTGDVFKPASYNKPAAIVRYNLLNNPQDCFNRVDWAGGYLYIR
ncbi:MAG: hypothetical protein VYD94_02515 [Thermoproteota archaeon]|nr:hypothetical protein [Thermoproteota archaeon]